MASRVTQLGTWRAWLSLAPRFRPYRWQLSASLLLAIAITANGIAGPLLLVRIIDIALPRHDRGLLILLCSIMLVMGAIGAAATVGQNAITNWVGQHVIHGLRADVYARLQSVPLTFFNSRSNTEIQARLASDIGGISDMVTFTAQGTVSSLTNLAAYAAAMIILSWRLALISMFLAAMLNLLNARFTERRRKLARLRQENVAAMLKAVGEDLSLPGVILGRTMGRQAEQESRFLSLSEQVARLTFRQRLVGNSARAVVALTLSCIPPLLYLLAGTVFTQASVGTVVVLAFMQLRLSVPIQQLLGLSSTVQSGTAMLERVQEYLDLPTEPAPFVKLPHTKHAVARPATLSVRDLNYRYPSSGRQAVKRVWSEFPAGSTTMIMGPSGSGKSTLALLLAGLLTPESGVISLDGASVSASALRANVTLVPQDVGILNASIKKNLLFAKPGATVTEMRRMLAIVRLDTLVDQLPGGINAIVGERGYELSGGERQRLALARALLSPGRCLILDEATSALDAATADAVTGAVREFCQRRTLLVIGHRLPHPDPSDRLLFMDGGAAASHAAAGPALIPVLSTHQAP